MIKVMPMILSSHPDILAALTTLEEMLESVYRQKQLPGMSTVLVYDQEIAWSKSWGYANLDTYEPVDLQTVFDAGSIVKMLTDTMMMQLRDAGKLNLDDPIERTLPSFRLKSSRGEPPPTFRQVAGHISGVPREPGYTINAAGLPALPPVEEVLDRVQSMDFIYPPMTGMHYSNLAVYILGHALSHIAGQPYKSYVQQHILEPLGMDLSGWEFSPAMQAHRAQKYIPLYGDKPRGKAIGMDFGDTGAPGGGFSTSVRDLARFMMFQFHDGSDFRQQILSHYTLQEMRLPVWSEPWGGTAIGWFLGRTAGHKTISHGGSAPGCSAALRLCPDLKLGFALMMNEMNFMENALSEQALGIVIPAFEKALAEQHPPVSRPPLPEGAGSWAGFYTTPADAWHARVQVEGQAMKAVLGYAGQDLLTFDLLPDGASIYTIKGSSFDGEKVSFEHIVQDGARRMMLWGLPFERHLDG